MNTRFGEASSFASYAALILGYSANMPEGGMKYAMLALGGLLGLAGVFIKEKK